MGRHKAWARCESHRSDCPASPLAMMSSLSAICFFFGWLKLSLPLQCLFFGIKAAAQLSALGRFKHAQLFYCFPPLASLRNRHPIKVRSIFCDSAAAAAATALLLHVPCLAWPLVGYLASL